MEAIVQTALLALAAYLGLGFLFALWFVSLGHRRLDTAAISLGGRLMILPASAALWPLLLLRIFTVQVPLNTPDGDESTP